MPASDNSCSDSSTLACMTRTDKSCTAWLNCLTRSSTQARRPHSDIARRIRLSDGRITPARQSRVTPIRRSKAGRDQLRIDNDPRRRCGRADPNAGYAQCGCRCWRAGCTDWCCQWLSARWFRKDVTVSLVRITRTNTGWCRFNRH